MPSQQSANPFQAAVEQTPDLGASAYHTGLRALSSYSSKIRLQNARALGSIYLEECVSGARWDYGIGVQKSDGGAIAVWVEVHPAKTSEVDTIKKLQWLKQWLRERAPLLNQMTPPDAFYWVATSGVNILPDSSQARLLATHKIRMPREVLEL